MIIGADIDTSKWRSVPIQDNESLFAVYKAEGTAVAETPKLGLEVCAHINCGILLSWWLDHVLVLIHCKFYITASIVTNMKHVSQFSLFEDYFWRKKNDQVMVLCLGCLLYNSFPLVLIGHLTVCQIIAMEKLTYINSRKHKFFNNS